MNWPLARIGVVRIKTIFSRRIGGPGVRQFLGLRRDRSFRPVLARVELGLRRIERASSGPGSLEWPGSEEV